MLSLEPCDANSSVVHQLDRKVELFVLQASTQRVIFLTTFQKTDSKQRGSEWIAELVHVAQLFLSYL